MSFRPFDDLHGSFRARPAACKGFSSREVLRRLRRRRGFPSAPHFQAAKPVSCAFEFCRVPMVADNDPNGASHDGCAVRFIARQPCAHRHRGPLDRWLPGAHRRAEFLEFLRALKASGPEVPSPKPIEQFLGTHPKALAFVQTPKPIPTSFARESYFACLPISLSMRQARDSFVAIAFAGCWQRLPERGGGRGEKGRIF